MLLAYTRVSTDEQATEERTSLAEQQRMLKGFAIQKGYGTLEVTVYSDTVSGSVPVEEREGGKRLLDTVRPGDFVVAAKIDRMFRSTLDALHVADKFKEAGVHLGFLDFMGGEPVTGDGPARFFFTVLSAVAQLERDRIRQRMMEGKQAKAALVGHIGGIVPYGYQKKGDGRFAMLVPHPEEQIVVKRAVALNVALNAFQIARELDREGFKNRKGQRIHHNQVQRMMRREARHDSHRGRVSGDMRGDVPALQELVPADEETGLEGVGA